MTGVWAGRCYNAISTAWTTNRRSCRGLIDHPTTRPEHKSSTAEHWLYRCAVRIEVLSVSPFLVLGSAALKSRSR